MKIKKLYEKMKTKFSLLKERKKGEVKTSFKLIEVAVIVAVVTFIGMFCGVFITYSQLSYDRTIEGKQYNINKDLGELSDIYESILDNYYKDIDKDVLIDAAIDGMLSSLDDPYSSYLDSIEKVIFDERMRGEYRGIGVELITNSKGEIIILNVFNNTPAQRGGLKSGDIITMIDDKDTSNMSSSDIANHIKRKSEDSVIIKVDRNGKTLTFPLSKEKVILESVTSETFVRNEKKVGYIGVSIFAGNTYKQFREAVLELEKEKIDSLIIDVRNNSGGYLDSVVKVVSMFLPEDTIIYQIESNKVITKYYDKTEEKREYPVTILINKQSASASEILAAAFKEIYNSQVVGIKSFGKGTVQETKDLENGGMIKFTTQRWLTPKGNSIDRVGVEPTVVVTIDSGYWLEPTTEKDNQLQKAIEILTK